MSEISERYEAASNFQSGHAERAKLDEKKRKELQRRDRSETLTGDELDQEMDVRFYNIVNSGLEELQHIAKESNEFSSTENVHAVRDYVGSVQELLNSPNLPLYVSMVVRRVKPALENILTLYRERFANAKELFNQGYAMGDSNSVNLEMVPTQRDLERVVEQIEDIEAQAKGPDYELIFKELRAIGKEIDILQDTDRSAIEAQGIDGSFNDLAQVQTERLNVVANGLRANMGSSKVRLADGGALLSKVEDLRRRAGDLQSSQNRREARM
ncbi:MAG: hypothetical protein WCW16_01840 [Candidatus Magasanikbacteria bacterium]